MPCEVLNIRSLDELTRHERKMSHFFKCVVDRRKCCYTGNSIDAYLNHLKTKHPNSKPFCYLCHELDDEFKTTMSPADLVDHQLYEHGFRIYQCNLCLYRAARLALLHNHHTICHFDNYRSGGFGINQAPPCKAIFCPRLVEGPHVNDEVLFLTYRSKRINLLKKADKYQCLFCSFLNEDLATIWVHIVRAHPDYNFCAYDLDDDLKKAHISSESCVRARTKEIEVLQNVDTNELNSAIQDLADQGVTDYDDYEAFDEPAAPPPAAPEQTFEPELGPSNLKRPRVEAPVPTKPKRAYSRPLLTDSDSEGSPSTSTESTRRQKPDHQSLVNDLQPLNSLRSTMGAYLYCVLCQKTFISAKKSQHLESVHGVTSALKCSVCNFMGQQDEIRKHIASDHSSVETAIVKFLVPSGETKEEVIKRFKPQHLGTPSTSANKPTLDGYLNKNKKGEKGYLMGVVKDSIYMGPGRGETTKKYQATNSKKQSEKSASSVKLRTAVSNPDATGVVENFDYEHAERLKKLSILYNLKEIQIRIPHLDAELCRKALQCGGSVDLGAHGLNLAEHSDSKDEDEEEVQIFTPPPKPIPEIVDLVDDEEDREPTVDDLEKQLMDLDS